MQEFDNDRFNFRIKWLLYESIEKEDKIYRQRSISIRKTKCNGKYNIGILMDEIKSLTLQRVSTNNWKLSGGLKSAALLGKSQNFARNTEMP
jgi:hypothetical protein